MAGESQECPFAFREGMLCQGWVDDRTPTLLGITGLGPLFCGCSMAKDLPTSNTLPVSDTSCENIWCNIKYLILFKQAAN